MSGPQTVRAAKGTNGGKRAVGAASKTNGKKAAKAASASKAVEAAKSTAATVEEWSPSKGAIIVSRMRAKWGSLAAAEVATLDSLSTEAQRSALGGKTRARGVAEEAVRWAVSLDRQLKEYAVLREHYHPKRFAYYLLRVEALIVQLLNEGGRGKAKGVAKSGAEEAARLAKEARARLLAAMGRFAGSRKVEWVSIEEARGTSESDDDLAASIQRLAALSTAWRRDGEAFLLEVSGLTQARIDDAVAAAKELVTASASATEAGPAAKRDSPTVNILEGWVLEEMKRAMEDVASAKEESPVVERLVPGVATRQVLGGRRRTSAKAQEKDTKATEGGEPAPEGSGGR